MTFKLFVRPGPAEPRRVGRDHMKRVGIAFALLIGLLAGHPVQTQAQAQYKFPSKPIRILLPYGAGSEIGRAHV
mgnify:CR=1 FL=1